MLHVSLWLRLLSRVSAGNGEVNIRTLYNAYKFECLEAGGDDCPVGIKQFVPHVQKLFPDAKRNRKKSGETLYDGLVWEPLAAINASNDFSCVGQHLTEGFVIVTTNADHLTCTLKTGVSSNGCEIVKYVTFNNDLTWKLTICGTNVNLKMIGVANEYTMNEEGVKVVCDIAKKVKMCCGVTVTTTVVVGRFHTFEHLQNVDSTDKKRIIRSLSCNRIHSFNALNESCIMCRKMTFDTGTTEKLKENVKIDPIEQACNGKEKFKEMIPGASDEMIELLMDQAKNVSRDARGRRWSRKVVAVCLQLYTRSPHAYDLLRTSKLLVLPSTSLLVLYKNYVKQDVGLNENVFQWMYEEAQKRELPEGAFSGGLIFDEMAIQTDLQIHKSGDVVELAGFTDIGEEGNICATMRSCVEKKKLGTHILQMVFLGLTGFRFPVAHFVTDQVQGTELYSIFWSAVDAIMRYGFKILFTCMDGAQCNRTFMHINTASIGTCSMFRFTVPSPCSLNDVTFLMDYSHCAKKIRNNILKSGVKSGCTRNLTLPNGHTIQWEMFRNAYIWDRNNSLSLHYKLTSEHLYPKCQEKMRNHLAEQVLDNDMLNLMHCYKASLGDHGCVLDGVIELLENTSKLVEIFRDMRPVSGLDDSRLKDIQLVCNWFANWKASADAVTGKDRYKAILSLQCHDDIQSCGVGFIELCTRVLKSNTRTQLVPGLINSDIIENHFNQQRSTYHGANTNPNVLQYNNAQNSIILGQSNISKKANAARVKEVTTPLVMLTSRSLKRKTPVSNPRCGKIKCIRF